MTDTRWTIKNALRCARAARNAVSRTVTKYGRNDAQAMRLAIAHRRLVEACRELVEARDAVRRTKARAA